jgi:hypothetical protein
VLTDRELAPAGALHRPRSRTRACSRRCSPRRWPAAWPPRSARSSPRTPASATARGPSGRWRGARGGALQRDRAAPARRSARDLGPDAAPGLKAVSKPPHPLQSSFNGGEISQLIAARSDVAKYGNACELLENFIPTIQGPAIARPGFPFVAEVKASANRTWLDALRLLRGPGLHAGVRRPLHPLLLRAGAGDVTAPATPYEIASPYAVADLTNSLGGFALSLRPVGRRDPHHAPGLPVAAALAPGPDELDDRPGRLQPPAVQAEKNTTATTIKSPRPRPARR